MTRAGFVDRHMEFTFTLKFRLTHRWSCGEHPGAARALAAAGVQLARQRRGALRLEFLRAASDGRVVIRQAIADIRRVIPMAVLAEAGPDYIGLTGLARLFGLSRQALRKLMVTRGGRFPSPVHEVHGAVWHLAEVLEWLDAMRLYRIDMQLLEISRAAAQVNVAVECQRMRAVRRHTDRLIELPRDIATLLRAAGLPV